MDNEQPQNWYFTFGFGQPHANCFIVFFGTKEATRKRMIEAFGQKWSMQYSEEKWIIDGVSQESKYRLKRIY